MISCFDNSSEFGDRGDVTLFSVVSGYNLILHEICRGFLRLDGFSSMILRVYLGGGYWMLSLC